MIRIVFVDDELNILHAMRRTMNCMRNEWSMEFLSSAQEALASLATNPAEVVVTDMRMPGMDGWQLLGEVKKLYPQTIRFVLSGYAEPGAIMRLVGTAHQYIAKPGESELLKTAIAQTLLMKRLLASNELARLVGGIGALPSFPKAFEEISHCLRQPNATLSEAARIISRDVAMTANVMKIVNSAFFGARRQVTSVERAVALLGLDTLTALVLGHDLFRSGPTASEALWQHSLRTAMAAQAIVQCERLRPPRAEEAFLTGMLHDIGRLVFEARASEPSANIIDPEAPETDVDLRHAEVGGYLLGLWGFPSHIVAAVAQHHAPGQRADAGLDLTVIVHVADRLAHYQGEGSPTPEDLGIEAGLLEHLKLLDRWALWLRAIDSMNHQQALAEAL